MTNRTRERRKKLIVDKQMQAKLMATASLVPAAAMCVTALVVLWFARAMQDEALRAEIQLENAVPLSIAMACFLLVSRAFLTRDGGHQVERGPALGQPQRRRPQRQQHARLRGGSERQRSPRVGLERPVVGA